MAPTATWPSPVVSSFDALLTWLDGGVCSQIPSHSFWIAGQPLPLCARDLGLFGAFLLTLPFAPRSRRLVWLWGLAPLIVDGANSFAFETFHLSLYQPSNVARLATGALAGACLALAIAHLASRWQRQAPALSAAGDGASRLGAIGLLLVPAGVALLAAPSLALGLLGTAGALSLIATANFLARPNLQRHLAWALTLPELALLATAKHGLLAVLR